ncbi:MAG TPA: FG-GAP-like repeat-containing protein, partial [Chitinophagaceae bacterium]|nr:FG-GAP-like repeat-containing protein [Chitinophagaceae bacterium]
TEKLKGFHNGAAYADLDLDGDLDIVINSLSEKALLLRNNSAQTNYLSISFVGESSNTSGIGAKAYLFQAGKFQYQQLMITRGFESASDSKLHFGLGKSSVIDSLMIVWPNEKYQVIKNIHANQRLTIHEKNASGTFNSSNYFPQPHSLFYDASESISADWVHKENEFLDVNVQYLIPHALSTRGPKLAIADINGDGLDDLYACGAKDQPGILMLQKTDGSFAPVLNEHFESDKRCEDVDAVFFDSNKDGHLDLYVVSGGNEHKGNNSSLPDRLYVNDQNGNFVKTNNSIPNIYSNKSCVSVADVDVDGDLDVFVGTLSDANAYGLPQTSHLLINDGKGRFSQADEKMIALKQIGMVTSSAFADINKDGLPDLIIAGEWMPITIFLNKGSSFRKTTIPNSTGWWQSLVVDDVNGDGAPDILAGNWGWNNKFTDGEKGPVKLYVSDFDKNGHVEQLLSYTRKGKEYPFLAKDEVERALPVLKKRYLLYADYAGLEMKEVFAGYVDKTKSLVAEQLGSAVFYGNGTGKFTISDLPRDLQLAPIFSFSKIHQINGNNYYIAGGNFFDVIPYEGRYDAQPLGVFSISNNKTITPVPQQNLSSVKGQIRDVKWIQTRRGKILVAARNNKSLLFLQPVDTKR